MSAYASTGMSSEVINSLQQRHFFHLTLTGEAPTRWQHFETSGGQREPILFELFWVEWPDQIPELIAGQGEMLAALKLV
jgi:hypothetical protein